MISNCPRKVGLLIGVPALMPLADLDYSEYNIYTNGRENRQNCSDSVNKRVNSDSTKGIRNKLESECPEMGQGLFRLPETTGSYCQRPEALL